jgi:hypothetical protein
VLSGENLHRLTVGMMAAPLGHRSPHWGHHGEVSCSRHVGLLGWRPCPSRHAAAAPRRRDLLGGVVVAVLPFVLLVVMAGWRCCGVCTWFVLLSGCWGSWSWNVWAIMQGAVVISVMVGRRRCSHYGLRYLSPWHMSVKWWMWWDPTRSGHDQWLPWYWDGSMCWGFSGSEASTIVYVQFECDNSMVEELRGAVWACSRLRLGVAQRWWRRRMCRRLVSVFSPMWLRMVVCCVGCVCFCFRVCSCSGVCFSLLCTNVVSF